MKGRIIGKTMKVSLLKEDFADVGGIRTYYRLYRVRASGKSIYRIGIVRQRDRCVSTFGSDKKSAYEMFLKLVGNTATPCTLSDIAQDFANREYAIRK